MSIFPTKVLLATDGSKEADLAATTAADLAEKTNSELHIVTVSEDPYLATDFTLHFPEAAERHRQEVREEVQALLDRQVERVREAGGKVAQTHLKVGRADDKIVSLAEEVGAGLVVMGSRGQGGIRRALMGSVSSSVVEHATCPVMVVRAEAVEFPTKLLVATDRSREAQLAATTAADLAKSTNSELHVVHVGYEPGTDEAQEELDKELAMIGETGATGVRAHLEFGWPAGKIVDVAEEIGAGVIIMGSRGFGGIRRALLGSIADTVVRHAHCAVLVVRQEE